MCGVKLAWVALALGAFMLHSVSVGADTTELSAHEPQLLLPAQEASNGMALAMRMAHDTTHTPTASPVSPVGAAVHACARGQPQRSIEAFKTRFVMCNPAR